MHYFENWGVCFPVYCDPCTMKQSLLRQSMHTEQKHIQCAKILKTTSIFFVALLLFLNHTLTNNSVAFVFYFSRFEFSIDCHISEMGNICNFQSVLLSWRMTEELHKRLTVGLQSLFSFTRTAHTRSFTAVLKIHLAWKTKRFEESSFIEMSYGWFGQKKSEINLINL